MSTLRAMFGPAIPIQKVGQGGGLPPLQITGPFTFVKGRSYLITETNVTAFPTPSQLQAQFDAIVPGGAKVGALGENTTGHTLQINIDWIGPTKSTTLGLPTSATIADQGLTPVFTGGSSRSSSTSPWVYVGVSAGVAALGGGGYYAYKKGWLRRMAA